MEENKNLNPETEIPAEETTEETAATENTPEETAVTDSTEDKKSKKENDH